MKLHAYLTPYTKISSKWIRNLSVTSKIIKLWGKNISINIHDLGLGNEFLYVTPKAQTVEGNIGNSDFIKIKNV